MPYWAVVLQNIRRENYSWHSVCLCSFSICVIIAKSSEHSMHLIENQTSTYCGLMKRTEGNVPNYWLTGSCFINAFSHLFSPSPYISSFSLMPIKCWAQCFRASLNSPASAHGQLQKPCPRFGSSHCCAHPGHGQETRPLMQTHPIMQGHTESGDNQRCSRYQTTTVEKIQSDPNANKPDNTGLSSLTFPLSSHISMESLSD